MASTLLLGLLACGGRSNVECLGNSSCDLNGGGVCASNPATGNQWCAYPDQTCPSGERFSTNDVGDGVGGSCVPAMIDAASDAEQDAHVGDGNVTCKLRVAFEDGSSGKREVYVADPDGNNLQNVSNNANADDLSPSWAPDGKHLAFQSNRSGKFDIFVVAADGSGLTNLTVGLNFDETTPRWSPDGNRIAFIRQGTVWTMGPDGSNPAQVETQVGVAEGTLAWSADNTMIAYGSGPGVIKTYVVKLGSTPTLVSGAVQPAVGASWSSANKLALYGGSGGANGFDIFTVNGDGTNLTDVTQTPPTESSPTWSPDATFIAFSSNKNGPTEVWKMPAGGGAATQITINTMTTSGAGDFVTDVGQDNQTIVFHRQSSSTESILGTIRIDGTNEQTFSGGANNARNGKFAACP